MLSTKSGREKEALKAATHAVALDCGGAELIVLKADLLTETGDVMQAETSLEKAIEKYQWMLNYEHCRYPKNF